LKLNQMDEHGSGKKRQLAHRLGRFEWYFQRNMIQMVPLHKFLLVAVRHVD